MCNLYRMSQPQAEIARLFDAAEAGPAGNVPELVFPGHPGLVVASGRGGVLQAGQMHWGFPLVLKGAKGQPLKPKPVNNARSDHLASPFWRSSFVQRRCLIPLEAYAEAEGAKGARTRSWFSLPEQELFACAGIWRNTEEWGVSFAMVITDANQQASAVHDRMPVILRREDHQLWQHGTPEEAAALCRPWAGQMLLERTDQPWAGRH